MTLDKRGTTYPGRSAAIPGARYDAPPEVADRGAGVAVDFHGEDGRIASFAVASLPLPGWHASLACAMAARIGPAGGLRTLSSATSLWKLIGRFMRFLASLPVPPTRPALLTVAHVEGYFRRPGSRPDPPWRFSEIIGLRGLASHMPLSQELSTEVTDYLGRRVSKPMVSRAGYSAGELSAIVTAARADVAALRERLARTERLLEVPPSSGPDHALATRLAPIAKTGLVPRINVHAFCEGTERVALARNLFVVRNDLIPMLVLLAVVTGRNIETLKELPLAHRVLDGRAVELRLIKRRRGARRWHETVAWEIGPPHRQLHTPGGLYLLLHQLMAPSRAISASATIWSTWRNSKQMLPGPHEHRDPFAASLGAILNFTQWAEGHDLRSDSLEDPAGTRAPLPVSLTRVRAAVEARRTREVGGHLPSAARSNTMAVLFRDYLRGDPSTIEWSADVIAEALRDAEQAALAAHRRQLGGDDGQLTVNSPGGHDHRGVEGVWNACSDPQRHPASQRPCRRVSFLDCFQCSNSLISASHLPAILALLDDLEARRTELGQDRWWSRYGPTWAAIRHDVLPRFTPAQLDAAASVKPGGSLLELAEDPWETP